MSMSVLTKIEVQGYVCMCVCVCVCGPKFVLTEVVSPQGRRGLDWAHVAPHTNTHTNTHTSTHTQSNRSGLQDQR